VNCKQQRGVWYILTKAHHGDLIECLRWHWTSHSFKQAEKRFLPTARECYRYQTAWTDHGKLGCPLSIQTTYGYSKLFISKINNKKNGNITSSQKLLQEEERRNKI
jgi:hypothetical protein